MQEIINNLALKIKNKIIRLRDFSDILVEEKIDNSIKFISLLSENNDLNKYYMTIISLMPKEYKTILSLYFENYSLDKIASLMDLDINDVNNRLKEGILFMEKIISLYNKTFDEKMLR